MRLIGLSSVSRLLSMMTWSKHEEVFAIVGSPFLQLP